MKNLFKKYWWIILIILVILGIFFWYQIRPSIIYSQCHQKALERAQNLLKTKVELGDYQYKEATEKEMYLKEDYDFAYKQCLRDKGINK